MCIIWPADVAYYAARIGDQSYVDLENLVYHGIDNDALIAVNESYHTNIVMSSNKSDDRAMQ